MRGHVQLDPRRTENSVVFFRTFAVCAAVLRLPQSRTDARKQFFDGERFGHIVVCAHVEPGHFVRDRVPCGQQDHRDAGGRFVRGFPQTAENLDAGQLRQHDVEDNQVIRAGFRHLQTGSAVGGFVRRIAFVFQLQLDEPRDFFFVFDDENVIHDPQNLRFFRYGCRWNSGSRRSARPPPR